MKDIEDDPHRWKDISYYWVGKINTVKMTIHPTAIYRFNAIPSKFSMTIFMELKHKVLKFV